VLFGGLVRREYEAEGSATGGRLSEGGAKLHECRPVTLEVPEVESLETQPTQRLRKAR